MKVLIDTNVVLDILLDRQPWYTNAVLIFGLSKKGLIKSYVPASAITDIFYISRKEKGKNVTNKAIKSLLQVFYPAAVTDQHIFKALDLDWEDFEDSVQFVVGEGLDIDYIVTRNVQDFSSCSIPAVTPDEFLKIVAVIET